MEDINRIKMILFEKKKTAPSLLVSWDSPLQL